MIPAMVYLLGMSTNVVVGTSLFQIIFVTANTTFFQSYLNQTVDIVLAALMIIGGVIGGVTGSAGSAASSITSGAGSAASSIGSSITSGINSLSSAGASVSFTGRSPVNNFLTTHRPQAPLLLLDPASPLLPHQLPPMQLPPTQPPPLPLVVLVKPPWPVWLVLSVSPPSSYKSTNQPDFSLRIRSISYSCLLHNTERKRNRKI